MGSVDDDRKPDPATIPRLQFAEFHLMLKSPRGVQIFRDQLLDKHGIDALVHVVDGWAAVQEWRKSQSSVNQGDEYHKRAVAVYDMYLRKDASRLMRLEEGAPGGGKEGSKEGSKEGIKMGKIDEAVSVLARCKAREYLGWFRGEAPRRGGVLRGLLGMAKKMEEKWTDQQIVPAGVFADIEWVCVVRLFGAYRATFWGSDEHRAYMDHVGEETAKRDEGMMADFLKLRHARFLTQAKDVKRLDAEYRKERERWEREIDALAVRAADALLGEEVRRLWERHARAEVREKTFQIRCAEQEVAEGPLLLADEAVEWAMDCAVDQTYEFYTKSLVETLWKKPECQRGMEEYAGFRKPEIKDLKKMNGFKAGAAPPVIGDFKKASADAEWLTQFLRGATVDEHSALRQGSPQSHAAGVIQRRVRGVRGRKSARKAFATTFTKKYDPSSKNYFYLNNSYNSTSWVRPALMTRLFPKSTW